VLLGVFGATVQLFSTVLSKFGIETTYADGTLPSTWRAAMKPNTRLVFLETPSNPLTEVFDISALAQIARDGGALLVVDNCFCTPALQRLSSWAPTWWSIRQPSISTVRAGCWAERCSVRTAR